jgi:hypothetical protein
VSRERRILVERSRETVMKTTRKTVMKTIVTLAVLAIVVAGFLGFTQPGHRVLSTLGSIYNEAIRLDPKNAAAYSNRGAEFAFKGDTDRAIAERIKFRS